MQTFNSPAAAPPIPTTLHETGLNADQVEQLLVKTLYVGEASGLSVADRVRLPFTILEALIERLRSEQLIEVRGANGSGAAAYRYALTDAGRLRAQQYFEISRYVGAAPVPLAAYVASIGGGPSVPTGSLRDPNIAAGGELFRLNCAQCHGTTGRGAPL